MRTVPGCARDANQEEEVCVHVKEAVTSPAENTRGRGESCKKEGINISLNFNLSKIDKDSVLAIEYLYQPEIDNSEREQNNRLQDMMKNRSGRRARKKRKKKRGEAVHGNFLLFFFLM